MSQQIYLLEFRGFALSAHKRYEGASERMASYSPERQKDMKVTMVRLIDD
jgi:hypothetical protein